MASAWLASTRAVVWPNSLSTGPAKPKTRPGSAPYYVITDIKASPGTLRGVLGAWDVCQTTMQLFIKIADDYGTDRYD